MNRMLDLFGATTVPGFALIDAFVTPAEEAALFARFDHVGFASAQGAG